MKKTSALLIFFFSIQISFGQINLVGTLPQTFLKHYEFKNAGNKIVDYSDNGEKITIYNYDGTIYQTILVPPPNVPFGNQFSTYLSEDFSIRTLQTLNIFNIFRHLVADPMELTI